MVTVVLPMVVHDVPLVLREAVTLSVAGRTDAGVHAGAQVVHFDSDAARSERGWRLGANTYLPGDVSVLWVREVPGHFHARFGATARRPVVEPGTSPTSTATPVVTLTV